MPMAKIVGSDIVHAVPLTLIAGIGYWIIGSVDWHIIGSLLAGLLPGIFIGSYFAIRVPDRAVRVVLAVILFAVADTNCLRPRNGGLPTAASSIFTVLGKRAGP